MTTFTFSTKNLPWPEPQFRRVPDESMPWRYRIELENPPFPPALYASTEFLVMASGRPPERPYLEWIPGVSLRIRTDDGYEISYQQMERDEEYGVVRFGVP